MISLEFRREAPGGERRELRDEGVEGEFAFARVDPAERTLTLGRDAMGTRPLFVHDDGRRVAVASTMAALLGRGDVPCVPDEGVVAEFLTGAPVSRAETIVRGVRRVLPGTTLAFSADSLRAVETTVRALDPGRVHLPADEEGCLEEFRAAVRSALDARLRGAPAAALLLSGGVDSGTLAALAGRGNLRAFTVAFPGMACDEEAAARATAAAAGIPHEVVPWTPPGLARLEEPARRFREVPGIPNLDAAAERIRALGIPVVLDGDGGDEILGESPWRAADLVAEGRLGEAWRRGGGRGFVEYGLRPFLPAAVRRFVRTVRPPDPLPRWIRPDFARRVGLVDRVRAAVPARGSLGFMRTDLLGWFRGGYALWCLEDAARWGEKCGADFRHPFLDLRVVETALALPDRLRNREGEDRVALRRAQDRVRFRAGKAEFTPALLGALRSAGFLDRPEAPLLADAGWIDPAALPGMVRDIEGRTARGEPGAFVDSMGSWTVFALETWLRQGRMGAP